MALKDPEPEPIPSGGAAGGTAFPHDWDDDVNVLMKDPTQGEPISFWWHGRGVLSLRRYLDQQHRRRAGPVFMADWAMV